MQEMLNNNDKSMNNKDKLNNSEQKHKDRLNNRLNKIGKDRLKNKGEQMKK